jgi:FkbM family methyltransferase
MQHAEEKSIQLGTTYGGFLYPRGIKNLGPDSIIYCIGAGEDISHDIELANLLGSKVYIFDPTPRAIDHVNYVKDVFDGKKQAIWDVRHGGGDPMYWDILLRNRIDSERIILNPHGLHTEDCTLKFYKPTNQNNVSHSTMKGMKSDSYIKVPVKSLKSIMNHYQHEKIDLLKIDVEGSECDILDNMLSEKIHPKYLSIDFDLGWWGERISDKERCMETIEILKESGYNVFHDDGLSDYSMVYKSSSEQK